MQTCLISNGMTPAHAATTQSIKTTKAKRSGVRIILVRPADVPAYVDHGAADLGIVGKDVLWESNGSHYELVDLHFGPCRLVLAVPEDSKLNGPETWPPPESRLYRGLARRRIHGSLGPHRLNHPAAARAFREC